jgi:hypothetical protein
MQTKRPPREREREREGERERCKLFAWINKIEKCKYISLKNGRHLGKSSEKFIAILCFCERAPSNGRCTNGVICPFQ